MVNGVQKGVIERRGHHRCCCYVLAYRVGICGHFA